MKSPISLILSLILSLFLSGYGTAELFRKKVDVGFEGGAKKVITKFKGTEKRVGEWQEKSRPVKEFLLSDLKRILDENKDDVQEITSIKSITRPHVYLAKRDSYSSPGRSYGPYGPGRNNCGPPPPQPYYPGKGYVTGKGYGTEYQSGNQKKYDNSYRGRKEDGWDNNDDGDYAQYW